MDELSVYGEGQAGPSFFITIFSMSKIFVGKINPLKLARWKSCIFEGR